MYTERSDSLRALAPALLEVQSKLEAVRKTKTADTGKYSYSYADLAEIMGTVQPLLADAGLVVMQNPVSGDDGVELETLLLHANSGEHLVSSYRLPAGGTNDPQALGKAITYARRYALTAMLGVVTEDDDANGARNSAPPFEPNPRRSGRSSSSSKPARKPAPQAADDGGQGPAQPDDAGADEGSIGQDRAVALQGELGKLGVKNALTLARKVTKRNVEALADLTDSEGVAVWQRAKAEAGELDDA